jgi:type IV secretion system protein TrbL
MDATLGYNMTFFKISLVTFLAVVFFAAPGLAQTAGQATIQDTNVMGAFFDQIENVAGRVLPFAEWLFYTVLLIQIIYVGLMWMNGGGIALEYVWRNVLLIGFYSFWLNNYEVLQSAIFNGFIWIGQEAGGMGASAAAGFDYDFNEQRYSILGPATGLLEIGGKMLTNFFVCETEIGFFDAIPILIGWIFSAMLIFLISLGIIFMAIHVLMIALEFYLITGIGVFLMAGSIFPPLKQFGDALPRAFFALGIKAAVTMLVATLVMAHVSTVGQNICGANPVDRFASIWLMAISSFFYLLLFLTGPRLASTLLGGSGSMGAGQTVMTAAQIGGAVAGGIKMAAAGSQAISSGQGGSGEIGSGGGTGGGGGSGGGGLGSGGSRGGPQQYSSLGGGTATSKAPNDAQLKSSYQKLRDLSRKMKRARDIDGV